MAKLQRQQDARRQLDTAMQGASLETAKAAVKAAQDAGSDQALIQPASHACDMLPHQRRLGGREYLQPAPIFMQNVKYAGHA